MSASRLRLLEVIEAQPSGTTSAALATQSGLHENTVRGHLEALLEEGFLTRTPVPANGPGRPAWLWQAAFPAGPDPQQQRAHQDYARLAAVLAETLSAVSSQPDAVARQAGHAWGQQIIHNRQMLPDISPHNATAVRSFTVDLLDELGYAPAPDLADVEIDLHNCPLLQAAVANPEVTCNVHLGLIHGALEAIGVDATASTLTPFASPGCCHLTLNVSALKDPERA